MLVRSQLTAGLETPVAALPDVEEQVKVYKVISRIDVGSAAYFPEGKAKHGDKVPSGGNGQLVVIDASGFVELSDEDAARLLAAGAITSLDLEIAALEKKRDEALKVAEQADADLEARKEQLKTVLAQKQRVGAGDGSAEEKSVKTPRQKREPVAAGAAKKR